MLSVRLRMSRKTSRSGSGDRVAIRPSEVEEMANIIEGMHSYFWLTSSRLREPIQDNFPYTTQALRQDLTRVRTAWDDCQAKRDRNAIYGYLSAVFDLVAWWAAEDRALDRAP